jgi:hypothetical protein
MGFPRKDKAPTEAIPEFSLFSETTEFQTVSRLRCEWTDSVLLAEASAYS